MKKTFFAILGVAACLLIIEIGLKISGVNRGYKENAQKFKENPLNFKAAMGSSRHKPEKEEGVFQHVLIDHLTQAFDPDLFWTIEPCSDYYPNRFLSWFKRGEVPSDEKKEKINSLGFRAKEIDPVKSVEEIRIFCMGDSCTFGLGVDRHETFAAGLARLLSEVSPEKRIAVYNAGTPGYTSYQGLQLLNKKILALQPDILILSYGINDNAANRNITDADFALLLRETPLKRFQQSVLHKSEIYLALKKLIMYGKSGISSSGKENTPRVPLSDFEHNYEEMVSTAENLGIKAVIFRPALAGRSTTEYLDTLPDLARRLRVSYFDGKAYLEQASLRLEKEDPGFAYNDFFIDALHPSVLGHAVIARGLYELLISDALLQ